MRLRALPPGHVLLLAAIAVAPPSASRAQPPAQAFDELTTRLRAGDIVWVAAGAEREIRGRFIDVTPAVLTIESGGRRIDLTRDEVSRVRREHADSKWNGAIVGAGLALVVPLWYCSQAYERGETCGEGIKALTIIGAIGAGIGAGVDAGLKQRVTVYERQSATSTLRIVPAVSPNAAAMVLSVTEAAQPGTPHHPAGRVAVSYATLHEGGTIGTVGIGWLAAVSARLRGSWEIAGELGRGVKDTTELRTRKTTRWTVTSLTLGPRWARPGRRTTPFVHALVGESRLSSTLTSCGIFARTACESQLGAEAVTPRFVIQPGGGLDLAVARRIGLRLQGDYRLMLGEGAPNAIRLAAGLVVGL